MITVVGPERARAFIDGLAAALTSRGRTARSCVAVDLLDVPWIAQTSLLVCIVVPCGAREMDAMPQLRAVVSPILGYDWIDVAEASRRGIPVVNGEVPENRESMAEATVMLMLVLLYRLRETEAQMRGSSGEAVPPRRMLKARTVGIIGSGGIARHIIRRLDGWGADLQVHTRATAPDLPGVRLVGLDELLATSDIVVLMTSLDAGTRGILDGERICRMKPGVLLVNTARGGLIDESSLVDALRSGHIAAAALDVFEVEPLAADHPLRKLPNVLLTPHAVGHTMEMEEAIPRVAIDNVLQLVGGTLPASCRNREVASRWSAAR